MKKGLLAFGWLVLWGTQAQAVSVATPMLCDVTGIVVSVMQEEMQVAGAKDGTHVMVPVVGLEVASIAHVDKNYKGDFCTKAVPASAEGDKPKGYYRLCDAAADFVTGQTISGVIGASKGGGRYCLARIAVQN